MDRKVKYLLGIAIVSLTSALSTATAGQETAWAQKSMQDCQQEINEDNMKSFESQLSPYSQREYRTLNPEQKRKAMSYADKNQMSPDDAVKRVLSEAKR
jgi:hypothetical protein